MSTPNDFELYEFDLAKELMELPEEEAVRILREYRKRDYRIDNLFKKAIVSFFSLGYRGVFAAARLPYFGSLAVQDKSDRYNPPDIIHGDLRYEVKTAAYRRGQQNLLVNVRDHVGQPDIYILMVAHNPGHTTFACHDALPRERVILPENLWQHGKFAKNPVYFVRQDSLWTLEKARACFSPDQFTQDKGDFLS